MADNEGIKEDISEDELDQIIQDMSKEEEDEETEAPVSVAPSLEAVQAMRKPAESNAQQSISLEMSGVINLKLNFKNGERNLEVICTDDALICRMADGTEFRIPTGNAKARKAA